MDLETSEKCEDATGKVSEEFVSFDCGQRDK